MPAFRQENCSCVWPARKTGQGIVHYVTVCCEHRRQGKFVHGQPYARANKTYQGLIAEKNLFIVHTGEKSYQETCQGNKSKYKKVGVLPIRIV